MSDDDRPTAHTEAGDVRGLWRDIPGTGVRSAAFLGIPYAAAPVGPLRFGAPEPPAPWTGVRDAVHHGATPQRTAAPPSQPTLIPEPSVPGDETLTVNVFTPRPGDTGARLPVVVWIHGGAFTAGSPASPWYDGRAFNAHGIVVAVLSYRLGFDGFGRIPGAPSNRGVRDWLAGLEWVRANIASFGGDPDRVTIAGQSAGGGAVLTLLGMPQAQHLFRQAWALSPAIVNVPPELSGTLSAKLARAAEVPATRDGFARVSEERLTALAEKVTAPAPGRPLDAVTGMLRDGLPWGPALDGDLLPRPTLEAIAAGVGADKRVVVGTTDDEFTMATDALAAKLRLVPASLALRTLGVPAATRHAWLAANRPQRRRGTAAVVGRYITDAVFRAPLVRFAQARGAAPTWVYRFSWVSPSIGWACHCLDVPFFWNCLDSPDGIAHLCGPNPPQALADAVHGSAAAFVRGDDPGWPAWSADPGVARMFGSAASTPDVARDAYASATPLV